MGSHGGMLATAVAVATAAVRDLLYASWMSCSCCWCCRCSSCCWGSSEGWEGSVEEGVDGMLFFAEEEEKEGGGRGRQMSTGVGIDGSRLNTRRKSSCSSQAKQGEVAKENEDKEADPSFP